MVVTLLHEEIGEKVQTAYMTQIEFLQEIRDAYLKARKFIYTPKVNIEVLTRGTSHSISSVSEDLFACYCANRVVDPTGLRIFIDPPISFVGTTLKNKSEKKALLIRPDIALCRNSIVNCVFDIKTDLGFKRKVFIDKAKERNAQMNFIKSQVAQLTDGETKIPGTLKIAKDIKFVYVILSEGNISKSILKRLIDDLKALENIEAFVLSEGDHLNSYDISPRWQINQHDFDALDELLDKYLN